MSEYVCECEILHTGFTAPNGTMIDQWDATEKREEVIRCRDCRYFFDLCKCYRGNFKTPSFGIIPVNGDGFCAWAERRGDA